MLDANQRQKTAVIVEDDPDVRHLLADVLEAAGFTTIAVDNGVDGVRAVREHHPLITTLDVTMPGIDGFEAARRIRAESETYIIMLTALDDEADVVLGLTAGADEYINKPFRPRELRARINALLRRPRVSAPAAWAAHRDLRLHPVDRIVTVGDDEVKLTRTEFDLLAALLQEKGRVLSKSDLVQVLRGEEYTAGGAVGIADKRSIEAHMTNLRRKLGDSPAEPRYIETVRGVGYRLTSAADA